MLLNSRGNAGNTAMRPSQTCVAGPSLARMGGGMVRGLARAWLSERALRLTAAFSLKNEEFVSQTTEKLPTPEMSAKPPPQEVRF